MKIAKVVPVYKASDPSLLTNYRPISLLTSLSKLLEKLMYNNVVKFLTINNIFYEHHYGFDLNVLHFIPSSTYSINLAGFLVIFPRHSILLVIKFSSASYIIMVYEVY